MDGSQTCLSKCIVEAMLLVRAVHDERVGCGEKRVGAKAHLQIRLPAPEPEGVRGQRRDFIRDDDRHVPVAQGRLGERSASFGLSSFQSQSFR